MNFITREKIIAEECLASSSAPESGALVSFFGIVRNHHEGRSVLKLHYECYQAMADKQIQKIKDRVEQRWELHQIKILHRVGTLQIGEIAIAALVWSSHRAEAFAACSALVDWIKQEAPIWKKEYYTDGTSQWVLCGHPTEVASV